MTTNAIIFDGIEKRYGRQEILRGIDLTVQAGETLGLVGINGAGKSTLIKCLLDFTAVDAGAIHIFDVANTDPSSRKPLSYLPEKFIPPYYLTARRFLQYMARLHGNPFNQEEVELVLAKVDFDPRELGKPVRQLSKGMSQKLGLAACLLGGRELLVLDEPMSGLDPRARAGVKRHLQALKQEGRTLFSVPTCWPTWKFCATASPSCMKAPSVSSVRLRNAANVTAAVIWKTPICIVSAPRRDGSARGGPPTRFVLTPLPNPAGRSGASPRIA